MVNYYFLVYSIDTVLQLFFKFRTTCRNNAKTLDGNDYWVDGKGTQHKTWGGATFQGKVWTSD